MSLRIFSGALIVLAAGCASEPVTNKAAESVAAASDRIECALGEGAAFTDNCTLERAAGNMLVLRHKDGGFRKLTLDPDGTIDTADGADGVELSPLNDGRMDVVIGSDRYRLPAGL